MKLLMMKMEYSENSENLRSHPILYITIALWWHITRMKTLGPVTHDVMIWYDIISVIPYIYIRKKGNQSNIKNGEY